MNFLYEQKITTSNKSPLDKTWDLGDWLKELVLAELAIKY